MAHVKRSPQGVFPRIFLTDQEDPFSRCMEGYIILKSLPFLLSRRYYNRASSFKGNVCALVLLDTNRHYTTILLNE